MSALRVTSSRALRPQLSHRYQSLRAHTPSQPQPNVQTPPSSTAPSVSTASATPSPPHQRVSFFRRYRGAILGSTAGLALGLLAGKAVTDIVCPDPLPTPGSPEDVILTADLNRRIDEEFKVKVLRGKCLGVTKQLKGDEAGWVEILSAPIATDDDVPADPQDPFIDTLQGAKGFGVERVFWDKGEEKLVAIVWFGAGLVGWPHVAHGGVVATQLVEKLALAAALSEEKHGRRVSSPTGTRTATAAAVPQRLPGTGAHARRYPPAVKVTEPAQFSLSYVKPTFANNFYVIRVGHALDLAQDPAKIVPDEPISGRHEFEATLESMDSRIVVKAKAKFAPSSLLDRVEHGVVEGTKQTYSDFRRWLWPSRQSTSQT